MDEKKKINPKLVNLLIDRHIPSGEWIKPKDISELTYFLLSHSSNSFNGTLIDLEGGGNNKIKEKMNILIVGFGKVGKIRYEILIKKNFVNKKNIYL